MKLPEFGVKRPAATAMLFLAVLVLGVICFFKLGLDLTPEIEPTRVTVMTTWQGASCEDVETKVTRVLEKSLGSVPNLDEISSSTSEGRSTIACTFTWGTNIDEASNDIRARLDRTKRALPEDVDDPLILKFDSASMPVMVIGVTAKESIEKLYDIIDDEVFQPLQRLEGVGSVDAFGGLQRQINVTLSRQRLAGHGLTLSDIEAAIASENKTLPAGNLKIGIIEYTIRILGEYVDPDQIRDIPLLQKDGAIIRLKDVAEISDSFKEITQFVETMGRDGMIMIVQKRTGANTVAVCEAVRNELKRLETVIPRDIHFFIVNDFSTFITQSIANVRDSVYWGGLFVVLVCYLFLRNFRTSLVIVMTIPFSLIIAFSYMYFMGWTINIISLSALAIAIGMVVDNAIVVLENITTQVSRGVKVREASMFAASEVGLSLLASTATTICVFLPLVFVHGATGIMFRQLGGLVTATLLASLACALMLTPMLSSKLLKTMPRTEKEKEEAARQHSLGQKLHAYSERIFLAVENFYGRFLGVCLRHRSLVIIAATAVVGVSIMTIPFVGTEFTPDQDTGEMTIRFQLPVSTRAELTAALSRKIVAVAYAKEQELLQQKGKSVAPDENGEPRQSAIRFNNWRAGRASAGWGGRGSHIGQLNIKFLPVEERPYGTAELGDLILSELRTWPELARVYLDTSNRLMSHIMGGSNEKPIVVRILGYDLEMTHGIANRIRDLALDIPGVRDPIVTFDSGNREIVINIDRDAAAVLGVNVNNIVSSIRTLFYGNEASQFREGEDEYEIFVQLGEEERRDVSDLVNSEITVNGRRIRLDSFATISEELGPVTINRTGQERVIYLNIDVYERSVGEVAADLRKAIADHIILPPGIAIDYAGQIKEQGKSFRELTLMLVLGIILVYMVMAAQFESYMAPFIVMFSIPFAFSGAIFALALTGKTLNIMSFIGLIMLVGTVVNNAIVLIDYINILLARDYSVLQAITMAGRQRLRPVMMTTLTTIFGMLPMAMSNSTGSELWSPLSIAIIGGLSISTLVTLVFIPILYSLVAKPSKNAAATA
ncbi:MAG: Multidrug resistance protein MdtC [Lentisphaerae bacterium ADurb.Bin082]|nr:MAG: Multidrug resistance protein MdtC [Lentisphaerae bacterium ADurb.Bin082]